MVPLIGPSQLFSSPCPPILPPSYSDPSSLLNKGLPSPKTQTKALPGPSQLSPGLRTRSTHARHPPSQPLVWVELWCCVVASSSIHGSRYQQQMASSLAGKRAKSEALFQVKRRV